MFEALKRDSRNGFYAQIGSSNVECQPSSKYLKIPSAEILPRPFTIAHIVYQTRAQFAAFLQIIMGYRREANISPPLKL